MSCTNEKGVIFLRIQFVENYEQYKKGEDHVVRDGLALRLLEQGKARPPKQTEQKTTMLPAAPPAQANAKENEKGTRKKMAEGKK